MSGAPGNSFRLRNYKPEDGISVRTEDTEIEIARRFERTQRGGKGGGGEGEREREIYTSLLNSNAALFPIHSITNYHYFPISSSLMKLKPA